MWYMLKFGISLMEWRSMSIRWLSKHFPQLLISYATQSSDLVSLQLGIKIVTSSLLKNTQQFLLFVV